MAVFLPPAVCGWGSREAVAVDTGVPGVGVSESEEDEVFENVEDVEECWANVVEVVMDVLRVDMLGIRLLTTVTRNVMVSVAGGMLGINVLTTVSVLVSVVGGMLVMTLSVTVLSRVFITS